MKCEICGLLKKNLAPHLRFIHNLSGKEYKVKYKLDKLTDVSSTEKQRKTCIKRYGFISPLQNSIVHKKSVITNRKKYDGQEYWMQSNPGKIRFKTSMKKKYGVDWATQSSDIMETMKKNNIAKYGVDNPAKLPETTIKMKETCLSRYGADNPMFDEKIKERYLKKYSECFANFKLPTKPEQFVIDLGFPEIDYVGNGKFWIRFWDKSNKNPDFIIRPFKITKKVIEVFGCYFHKEEEEQLLMEKYSKSGYQCLIIWDYECILDIKDKISKFIKGSETTMVEETQSLAHNILV